MKLETYNYIKQCLEMGHEVKIRSNGGHLELLNRVDTLLGCSSNFWLDYYSDECEIIPRIPKLLQPGDKCMIIGTEETRKWARNIGLHSRVLGLVDCTFTVEEAKADGYLVENDLLRVVVPFFMVAPVPPEENKLADVDTEDMVKELESRGLLVNGKVLK